MCIQVSYIILNKVRLFTGLSLLKVSLPLVHCICITYHNNCPLYIPVNVPILDSELSPPMEVWRVFGTMFRERGERRERERDGERASVYLSIHPYIPLPLSSGQSYSVIVQFYLSIPLSNFPFCIYLSIYQTHLSVYIQRASVSSVAASLAFVLCISKYEGMYFAWLFQTTHYIWAFDMLS